MTKEESDKLYKELRKTYTDEEIAESFVWSIDTTPEEDAEFSKMVREYRRKHYADMTWYQRNKTKLRIKYFSLKYRLQDWWNR